MVGYLVHPSSWDYVNCMQRHLVCPHILMQPLQPHSPESAFNMPGNACNQHRIGTNIFADSTGLHCLRQSVSITCCPASTQYPLAYLELLHIHLCPFQFTQFTTGVCGCNKRNKPSAHRSMHPFVCNDRNCITFGAQADLLHPGSYVSYRCATRHLSYPHRRRAYL